VLANPLVFGDPTREGTKKRKKTPPLLLGGVKAGQAQSRPSHGSSGVQPKPSTKATLQRGRKKPEKSPKASSFKLA